jgi:ornithine carbamoyltransferase
MIPALHHLRLYNIEGLSAREVRALAECARALRRADRDGAVKPLLRGKNIGLLCEDQDSGDATLFRRAATALGAVVARIRPSVSRLTTPGEVLSTARVLGRLYDAVECEGLPRDLVQQIEHAAGIPVYDALVLSTDPAGALSRLLETAASDLRGEREVLLQALLVSTIG